MTAPNPATRLHDAMLVADAHLEGIPMTSRGPAAKILVGGEAFPDRLRRFADAMDDPEPVYLGGTNAMREAADLIEAQAERIVTLTEAAQAHATECNLAVMRLAKANGWLNDLELNQVVTACMAAVAAVLAVEVESSPQPLPATCADACTPDGSGCEHRIGQHGETGCTVPGCPCPWSHK